MGVAFASTDPEEAEWSLDELEALTDTAGADVVDRMLQRRESPHPASYLGKGKAHEVVDIAAAMDAGIVIFDDELTPAQGRNLEEIAGVNPLAERGLKIIDRTGLILDIFAQHARSAEGKLQVELAQLNYRLPRLRGWGEVLSRMGGGIGTRRGPGETALETERRAIVRRIRRVEKDLEDLTRTRRLKRKQRVHSGLPVVALVGYTNAGKSTILRRLSEADVLIQDQLFSTLDPTTRRLDVGNDRGFLLTDTVGFVRKLPHQLVEAFRSTLEEVNEATLLLHVVDANRDTDRQINAVNDVLIEIGAANKPVVLALNKSDLLTDDEIARLRTRFPEAVICSAQTGHGMNELLEAIGAALSRLRVEVELHIPFDRGDLVAKAHERGDVLKETYSEAGTHLIARIERESLGEFASFLTSTNDAAATASTRE
ncbi:MAG: GTPase HflX [Actinomycetota bacterium]|nr:GTPase HflX [Actinomycetota bacterium]